MWFKTLTGFTEISPEQVRKNISLQGNTIKSLANGQEFICGDLQIATLDELRNAAPDLDKYNDRIKLQEAVGDVQEMHIALANEKALFQAASQFNLLEMVGPEVVPEKGISDYEFDRTQGPACAIACGAGTIFRNYLVEVNGEIGQSKFNQINCLDEIGKVLNNEELDLWKMKNGYALANMEGLKNISAQLKGMSPAEYAQLKDKLKIGVQWNTEVTLSKSRHLVSQAYCSALPVRYSNIDADYWEDFARLILEATYEATFYAALRNYAENGSAKVFLTLVGGGAFGNKSEWIYEAIEKCIVKFRKTPLDVRMVSHGKSNGQTRDFISRFEVK